MTFFNSAPRTRLIALLIVAAFSISAVAVATGYVAAPASAAKKKKKCKKGYKKSKGKCKKIKKKATTAPKVTAVRVQLAVSNKGQVKVNGQLTTNVPHKNGFSGEIAVTVGGTTQTVTQQFGGSNSTNAQFSKLVQTNFADTDGGSVTVTVGGVTSAPVTIK